MHPHPVRVPTAAELAAILAIGTPHERIRAALLSPLPTAFGKITEDNPVPDTTDSLPDCCYAGPFPTLAESMYAAYNAAGDPATAGLNYQGLPCPTWGQLTPNIREKWIGAAELAGDWFAPADKV
jgi:hypothetical protein